MGLRNHNQQKWKEWKKSPPDPWNWDLEAMIGKNEKMKKGPPNPKIRDLEEAIISKNEKNEKRAPNP